MNHAKKSPMSWRATKAPAYSLVFAFLIMTVIMLVAGTTIENTHDKVIYFREIEGTAQARLAAESAAELAVKEIRGQELGYDPVYIDSTAGTDVFCLDYSSATTMTTGTCRAWANYDVRSVAETNSNDGSSTLFYTPIPGAGSAGLEDECSILDSDLDPDHPCNWNKLMYGQSVTVPLYAFDSSHGAGTYTPASSAIGFSDWYLKVRTPCVNEYEEDGSCDRYVFPGTTFNPTYYYDADEDGTYTPSIDDPSVILWQLLGEDSSGLGYQVLPDDANLDYFGTHIYRDSSNNTEISQSDITTSSDNIVLELSTHSDISDISTDSSLSLTSLVLQLDIVSLLVDSDGYSIPYLEWQFVTDSYYPFATNEMSVVGSGYYEGESGTFYFPYVVTRSSTGESTNVYTLSN